MRRVILAAALAMAVLLPASPINAQAVCRELYMAPPINERGISCVGAPGTPAVWKSYTIETAGFGWYTETTMHPNGLTSIHMYYQHRDGPLAYRLFRCLGNSGESCRLIFSNGVPLP